MEVDFSCTSLVNVSLLLLIQQCDVQHLLVFVSHIRSLFQSVHRPLHLTTVIPIMKFPNDGRQASFLNLILQIH